MFLIHSSILIDAASVTMIFVLLVLSRKLGEALKKRPFYKILYLSIGLIAGAAIISIIASSGILTDSISEVITVVSMVLRFISVSVAVVVLVNYWKWLFNEFNR